ncbi:MAG: hypothetical protein JJ899_04915 [Alphaproteobacteria bacterium]|nr:hypothetical protein [Alphaproteobacteria bacterium]
MHPTITAQALTRSDVDRAFPLVREANRTLTLDDWRHFATQRSAAAPGDLRVPGIVVALRNGVMRGLAALDSGPDELGRRQLFASEVVVIDRARHEWVARELLRVLLQTAQREKCTGIRVCMPRSSAWLIASWSDPEGVVFRLPVDCVPAASPIADLETTSNVVSLNVLTN